MPRNLIMIWKHKLPLRHRVIQRRRITQDYNNRLHRGEVTEASLRYLGWVDTRCTAVDPSVFEVRSP